MTLRTQLLAGLLLLVSGCVVSPGEAGPLAAEGQAAALPAPPGETLAGGNQAWFGVDGEVFRFRTPEVRHSRVRAGDGLVAEHFELERPDKALYVRLVLQVDPDRRDLSGEYAAVSLDDPAQAGRAGVGEVVLAEETDPGRGRRMLPSGSGRIDVVQSDGRLEVRFETGGDGLFRAADAAPVKGGINFHWRP